MSHLHAANALLLAEPFDPGADAAYLLSVLAWCSSAAGVAGVIMVGTQLALQLRRGEPGEGSTYFRGLVIIMFASLIATSAGPLVRYLGPLTL